MDTNSENTVISPDASGGENVRGGTRAVSQRVYVYTGQSWVPATPYIYSGNRWRQAYPFIFSNNEWKMVVG